MLVVAVKLDTTTGGSPAFWALQIEPAMQLGRIYLWFSASVLGECSSGLVSVALGIVASLHAVWLRCRALRAGRYTYISPLELQAWKRTKQER